MFNNRPLLQLGFVMALVFALGCQSAWAYTDVQIHEMVENRLLDRHPTDTPQWWQSLGENATEVMIGMYNAETNTFHRIRILQGLGWLKDPEAVDFVKEQAQRTNLDTVRNAAIRAIGRGQGAREIDFLSKYLKSKDPQTRLAAAESLKGIQDPRAQEIYQEYLKTETVPWLVDRLNGHLDVPKILRPVSSSSERISPEFGGTWRGIWVQPKSGATGMDSAHVVLELKPSDQSPTEVGGSLLVLGQSHPRKFSLGGSSGKGERISGNFIESITHPAKNAHPLQLGFEGHLTRMGDTLLLELKVPKMASIVVLKKD